MGDKRELVLTVVILVVAFLLAPVLIDGVPYLSAQGVIVRIILCFVLAIALFLAVVFVWAFLAWLVRKKEDKSE